MLMTMQVPSFSARKSWPSGATPHFAIRVSPAESSMALAVAGSYAVVVDAVARQIARSQVHPRVGLGRGVARRDRFDDRLHGRCRAGSPCGRSRSDVSSFSSAAGLSQRPPSVAQRLNMSTSAPDPFTGSTVSGAVCALTDASSFRKRSQPEIQAHLDGTGAARPSPRRRDPARSGTRSRRDAEQRSVFQ